MSYKVKKTFHEKSKKTLLIFLYLFQVCCSLADIADFTILLFCYFHGKFKIMVQNCQEKSKSTLFTGVMDTIHQLHPMHIQSIKKYTRR